MNKHFFLPETGIMHMERDNSTVQFTALLHKHMTGYSDVCSLYRSHFVVLQVYGYTDFTWNLYIICHSKDSVFSLWPSDISLAVMFPVRM